MSNKIPVPPIVTDSHHLYRYQCGTWLRLMYSALAAVKPVQPCAMYRAANARPGYPPDTLPEPADNIALQAGARAA